MKNSTKGRENWRAPLTSLDEALKEVDNHKPNGGSHGRKFEIALRYHILNKLERAHGSGITDITIKRGVTLEAGQGSKGLTAPVYETAQDALDYWKTSYKPMHKASHIAYSPTGSLDFSDTRVYTQHEFIEILESCGLVRAKADKGMFKVAIQSYKNSKKKYAQYTTALSASGESLNDFMERMVK